ncbi:MAG: tRNA(Ile)-lysidine synthase [marine bacterium B5-7]|nr:MAG: tRNA(Ile)-lysidine synthase [marine bacterium B5-7]
MSTSPLSQYSFDLILSTFPEAKKIWIACSGGIDSIVLLHLVFSNKEKIGRALEVVYVNHGLQEESAEWGEFCRTQCKDYELPFTQLNLNEPVPKGESIEAWAREKRYALITQVMKKGDLLFTAHHQDDQVETFFLQALRGAGPRGLSSMPLFKNIENATHVRPLLNYCRQELLAYANENKLSWQEDLSNANTKFDRNYLRNNIIPSFEKRWPAYRETIGRLLKYQQECKSLMNEVGLEDLKLASRENKLILDTVKSLSASRQKNVIFTWLQELQLETPGSKHINHIVSDLINSSSDNAPCVNWKNVEVRKYRALLYASKKSDNHIDRINAQWDLSSPLKIMDETLVAKPEVGCGLSKEKIENANVRVKYRQGGEKIQPNNHAHSKTVKQLFQERGVLPWVRDIFPLVYVNETLALIPGVCVDVNYAAKTDEPSWQITWTGYKEAVQS